MTHDTFAVRLTLPVHRYPFDDDVRPAADEAAWHVWQQSMVHEDGPFAEHFARFCSDVDTTGVRELTFGEAGDWEIPQTVAIDALVAVADRFPALRAIALGDISEEECEISWIRHGDVTPLLEAFPRLEVLEIQGGEGLSLRPVRHEALRVLRCESGGLPAAFVAGLAGSDLPALEELCLWLGVENYGGNWNEADLDVLLDGRRLPALRDLGLMNSERQDWIAGRIAAAPIVGRLERLSLGMGTLSDEGAEALLAGQPLTHLANLDLCHHFMSEQMCGRLAAALPGVDLDTSERLPTEDDGWRYVSVAE